VSADLVSALTPVPEASCIFCAILALPDTVSIVREWVDAVAFVPRDPVVPGAWGHVLVVPREHAIDFAEDSWVTAVAARRAAELVRELREHVDGDWNLITSAGEHATQTVPHLHLHLVRRVEGDDLHLPWTGQAERLAAEDLERLPLRTVQPHLPT
jgi:histidine triad (HIT) family protein